MALKTTNYEVKGLGTILPEAYAYIKNIDIRGTKGVAIIVIQENRDNAINKAPYETRRIYFDVNREENPYITAYKTAKGNLVETINPETQETETVYDGVFGGWEDDIVVADLL